MRLAFLFFFYLAASSDVLACRPFISRAAFFEPNSHILNESDSAKFAEGLKLYQPLDRARIWVIQIVGHASPDEHVHEEGRRMLSLKRAMAVQAWFVENGIPLSKTYVEGKGSSWLLGRTDQAARTVEVEYMIIPDPDPCAFVPLQLPQKQQ